MSELNDAVSQALGTAVVRARRTAGGDINDAFDVDLADGRRVFVKTNDTADPRLFACEARGLAWLREAEAIHVPRALAVGPGFLVLEHVLPAPRAADFDERFGEALARVHDARAPGPGWTFGFEEDNFIGSLPQVNATAPTWAEFYHARRLQPMLRMAIDQGRAPASWIARFERLYAALPDLAGPPEAPARLHGDLWSGNVLTDDRGAPVLIDPAVSRGHREVDLAMLQLFAAPSARFFDAYQAVRPLADDWLDRVALYQLYPLLVHVTLFGGSYVRAVDSALSRYV